MHKARLFKNRNIVQKIQAAPERAALSERLNDFPKGRGGPFLLGETADDVLPGDDADEAVQVVHHGDEVVPDDGFQQLIQGGGDADGGVLPEDVPDVEPFQLLGGAGTGEALVGEEPPEEVPLADGAHILALAVDDRDGAAAVVPELLQALAHGAVVVQVGDAMLWRQKVSNVHGDASFLMGRGDPPG